MRNLNMSPHRRRKRSGTDNREPKISNQPLLGKKSEPGSSTGLQRTPSTQRRAMTSNKLDAESIDFAKEIRSVNRELLTPTALVSRNGDIDGELQRHLFGAKRIPEINAEYETELSARGILSLNNVRQLQHFNLSAQSDQYAVQRIEKIESILSLFEVSLQEITQTFSKLYANCERRLYNSNDEIVTAYFSDLGVLLNFLSEQGIDYPIRIDDLNGELDERHENQSNIKKVQLLWESYLRKLREKFLDYQDEIQNIIVDLLQPVVTADSNVSAALEGVSDKYYQAVLSDVAKENVWQEMLEGKSHLTSGFSFPEGELDYAQCIRTMAAYLSACSYLVPSLHELAPNKLPNGLHQIDSQRYTSQIIDLFIHLVDHGQIIQENKKQVNQYLLNLQKGRCQKEGYVREEHLAKFLKNTLFKYLEDTSPSSSSEANDSQQWRELIPEPENFDLSNLASKIIHLSYLVIKSGTASHETFDVNRAPTDAQLLKTATNEDSLFYKKSFIENFNEDMWNNCLDLRSKGSLEGQIEKSLQDPHKLRHIYEGIKKNYRPALALKEESPQAVSNGPGT